MADRRRALPSVDAVLREAALAPLLEAHPRASVVQAVRALLASARAGGNGFPETPEARAALIGSALEAASVPTLRRCVNATGVVLHTNLGRAPLAAAAIEAIAAAAAGYSSLEYDVATGRRGSRHVHCAALIAELTGAEDALVVNNAASALLLALAAAAEGGVAVVSRGELIEIGGGFRVPEIMEKAGVRLAEVGTTNRTRLADYERALGAKSRKRATMPTVLLKVHRSNFRIEGFTAQPELAELAALARRRRIGSLYDQGSGLMFDLPEAGLGGEPTMPGSIAAGVTAVVCSGDKLLGGPQAGIIAGRRKFLAACRAHPLARAARADKLTLAGLAATLRLYRDPAQARQHIPVLRMLTAPLAELQRRAAELAASLPAAADSRMVTTQAAVGGGAGPGAGFASAGISVGAERISATDLATRLRAHAVPVVSTVKGGRVILDVRTLLPGDGEVVRAAIAAALR